MEFLDFWNKAFETYKVDKFKYAEWLDDYKDVIAACKTKALDLGCGAGSDSYYLTEKGLDVIACDYSTVALKTAKKEAPKAETMLVDISKPLPFENDSFDLIVADLCLHYFDTKKTQEIMQEIKRILTKNGHLLARVNSTADINHGAGQGEKIEENYYFVNNYNKRFFDENEVNKFFSIIGKVKCRETQMLRYDKPKIIVEVDAQKI